METEEDAFIRALRERPDDETTRLVYTDWLDDRSDPRAEYLRAEAAWVDLQPSDEQYRPLYRRVSQLAAGLEPEWFATVSRFPWLARHIWAALKPRADELIGHRGDGWRSTPGRLRRSFARYVGAEESARRFCVPADYLVYIRTIGIAWEWEGEWGQTYPTEQVGLPWNSAEAPDPRRELWVHFAIMKDMDYYFLCCDLGSPRFGEVAQCYDADPWTEAGPPVIEHHSSFLDFLSAWSVGRVLE